MNIKQGCIPVGCVPITSVVATRCQYLGGGVCLQGSLPYTPFSRQANVSENIAFPCGRYMYTLALRMIMGYILGHRNERIPEEKVCQPNNIGTLQHSHEQKDCSVWVCLQERHWRYERIAQQICCKISSGRGS